MLAIYYSVRKSFALHAMYVVCTSAHNTRKNSDYIKKTPVLSTGCLVNSSKLILFIFVNQIYHNIYILALSFKLTAY